MKHFSAITLAFIALLTFVRADEIRYTDSWGKAGFTVERQDQAGVKINYSITEVFIEDLDVNGESMKTVNIPGIFLFNDAGAPNLPGTGRYIAIPQGANASVKVIASRVEKMENFLLSPAPRIPLDTERGPLQYEKNMGIYSRDAFYPEEPVILSATDKIRGVDVVMLGITPFQYNPVTRELLIYRDLQVEITYEGGNGHFGEDRLRSRWFDPILLDAVLNCESLPEMDYSKPPEPSDTPDWEYIIIVPNDNNFIAWGDSVKRWRTLQGIRTGVVTTSQIGGNTTSAIENYVNTAYNTWAIPPVAVLLIGDYGTSGTTIVSPIYNSYCVSDNIYADVDNNHLPDIVFARMTAQNSTHLSTMIRKAIKYERTPPTSAYFYSHPITALGWQTERWFQICSETIGGFWKYELGKTPVRINAIYSGTPGSVWSTATNTSTVVNFFGPSGLGYIPSSPSTLGGWTGGNATMVNNAINSGAFMMQHRDHGSTTSWGEPYYTSSNINSLTNTDLTWVLSINCLTGKYNNSSEVFAEKFHRHTYSGQPAGALGITAASETSYSFVNDTYVWGLIDNMWPEFMPTYGSNPPPRGILPAFGNAAGKYFLQQSSWPYNTNNKQVTYHLFHHHGDAFTTVYSEVPQSLTVNHAATHSANNTTFAVTANSGSFIALTVNGEIIGTANGTGNPVNITIPVLTPGDVITIVVTKQNYYRYTGYANVTAGWPQVDLKVILEGPYNGIEMTRWLNNYNYLPLSQPYNASPWNYSGTEAVASIPNGDIVDWILVELRQTSGSAISATSATMLARQAAFLLRDGTVVSTDGSSLLTFYNTTITQNLYAVVWHRNHLGIMSNYPLQEVAGVYSYDFSAGLNQVFGGPTGHKDLGGGVCGMMSADGDSDGQVTTGDKVDVWIVQSGQSGYLGGDFNLNGNVENGDKVDYWGVNAGMGCQVPQ
ncbi:MAG: hypothetical protein JW861_04805 [Bacteroidales bacterium]|nr:hypothetical protein [Bacteroidales bacterium]